MSTSTITNPNIVSRDEWLIARKQLLAREKQLTRERDGLAAERRRLPWVKPVPFGRPLDTSCLRPHRPALRLP